MYEEDINDGCTLKEESKEKQKNDLKEKIEYVLHGKRIKQAFIFCGIFYALWKRRMSLKEIYKLKESLVQAKEQIDFLKTKGMLQEMALFGLENENDALRIALKNIDNNRSN